MINNLKLILRQPFYFLLAIESSFGMLLAFWWVLRRQSTFVDFYIVTSDELLYFWPFVVLTVITIAFFGALVAVSVYSWNNSRLKSMKAEGGGMVGAFLGAIGSACPLCSAFFASFFGVAWSLGSLPLKGLELKAGSVLILGVALFIALKKVSASNCKECGVNKDVRKKNYLIHLIVIVLMILFGADLLSGEIEVFSYYILLER